MSFGPIKGAPKRRRYLTYDLEWRPDNLQLRLIGVYDGEQYRSYTTVSDFLNGELTTRSRGAWLYAHAGGKFDLRWILEYLADNPKPWIRVEGSFVGSSAIIVKIRKGRNCWWLVDSYWLIRASLRKIAKMIGEEKGGAEGETEIFYAPLPVLREYNARDVIILWRAIRQFEDVLRSIGGQLQMTVASTALDLFRRRYLRRKIGTLDAINDVARHAYVASRVEVFSRECQTANYYDINSSFPAAMRLDAPGNYLGAHQPLALDDSRTIQLADATIHVPDCAVPPLPYRTRDRRLFFPVGTWRAWFADVDLRLLEESGGTIDRVHDVRTFEPFHDLRDYATEIYRLRMASDDPAHRMVYKILANSLYGKFAERSTKQSFYLRPESTDCPHMVGGRSEHSDGGWHDPELGPSCWTFLAAGLWLFTDEKDVRHAHVPISVIITAHARAALYRSMLRARRIHYCDTDGFAADPASEIPTGDGLGELKLEKRIRWGRFLAPKLYAYETDAGERAVRAKGFGGGLTYAQFCELHDRIDDDSFVGISIRHFNSLREDWRRGKIAPSEQLVTKRIYRKQRPKRRFRSDGSSEPWPVTVLDPIG